MKPKRVHAFFAVDAIAFVLFVGLVATGVLVHFTLPAGSGHFATVWGMDRHEWGDLHFWMAIGLLAAVTVHLFFHWRWIVSMIKGRPSGKSWSPRVPLACVGLAALATLALAPLLAPVEQTGTSRRHVSTVQEHAEASAPTVHIDGSMTLRDVEEQTGIPAAAIAAALELPDEVPADARLGRLRRAHGFEMSDVRRAVESYTPPD